MKATNLNKMTSKSIKKHFDKTWFGYELICKDEKYYYSVHIMKKEYNPFYEEGVIYEDEEDQYVNQPIRVIYYTGESEEEIEEKDKWDVEACDEFYSSIEEAMDSSLGTLQNLQECMWAY